jgi:hypothetical protein
MKKFSDFIKDTKELKLIKNKKYLITDLDETSKPIKGFEDMPHTYVGTGKGRQSPNKGKDVHIFIDDDTGLLRKIGFWSIESGWVIIKEA